MNKTIAQVVVGLPVEGPFDYLIPQKDQAAIATGSRVDISFGSRRCVGYVTGFKAKSSFRQLKSITAVLDNHPALDERSLKLTKEFSLYYGCSWGEAIETSLPPALRKKTSLFFFPLLSLANVSSAKENSIFCHDLGTEQCWSFLLEQIQRTLSREEGVIILVPEAAIIDNVKNILEKSLAVSVCWLGKKMTAKNELKEWISIKEGKSRVVVGTRSAVFAPVNRLGLIVVTDEDNNAYKQEQSPCYHVRDVIAMRLKIEGGRQIIVSAAPCAETWWRIKRQKAEIKRFESDRQMSDLKLIDLSNYKPYQQSGISFGLSNHLQFALNNQQNIILFLNLRGFSARTHCNQCGHTLKCERCNVSMSYLYSKKKLVCHLCSAAKDMPNVCPQCNSSYLRSTGGGIEKIESDLARIFPNARIEKFDRETASVPRADIIIATQAIMKSLQNIRPDMIGVLEIDTELNRFDFRCAQRVFSLLIQCRRAARNKVIVQTKDIDNYCLRMAAQLNFEKFYKQELKVRKELNFPPFRHFVQISLRGKKEEDTFETAKQLYQALGVDTPKDVEIFDPQPDQLPKLRDQFRFSIILKGAAVPKLFNHIKRTLKNLRRKKDVIITFDVDP